MIRHRLARITLLALAGGACTGPLDCTQVEPVALEIRPVDAVTGTSLADSANGTFTVDGITAALGPRQVDGTGKLLTLAGGQGPGTYQVHVEHPRFAPWDSGIVVLAGAGCQYVIPVTVIARLVNR